MPSFDSSGSNLEGQGRLTLSANAEDLGNSEGTLDIDIEGEEGKIAFNVRFLTDLVQHSHGGTSNPVETDGDGAPGTEKTDPVDNHALQSGRLPPLEPPRLHPRRDADVRPVVTFRSTPSPSMGEG